MRLQYPQAASRLFTSSNSNRSMTDALPPDTFAGLKCFSKQLKRLQFDQIFSIPDLFLPIFLVAEIVGQKLFPSRWCDNFLVVAPSAFPFS
jgi:hypothetical protein